MATIEIKGYIYARIYAHQPDRPEFDFMRSEDPLFLNTSYCTNTMIQPITITAEIPDEKIDYRSARIAALEKEREKVRAELGKRIAEIADEISKLQAIEYTPEVRQ